MKTFLLAVLCLVLGYIFYGRIIEKNFGPDDRTTPALEINDGVDFVPMPTWKVLLIQILNIAGTGPIFGALSGALFGPVVYLWIVFGCILQAQFMIICAALCLPWVLPNCWRSLLRKS